MVKFQVRHIDRILLLKMQPFKSVAQWRSQRQAATRKVFNEGQEDCPVGVRMFIVLVSSCQISKQLYPRETEARDAR